MVRKLAVVALLAACHSSTPNNSADAPNAVADAASDAAPGDATPGVAVTVTVRTQLGDGAADPTASVVFTDAANEVVAVSTVDASGRASVVVPAGSDMTVIQAATDPNNLTRRAEHITTIRGVQAGDQLVVGKPLDANYRAANGMTDTMTATWTPLQAAAAPSILMPCVDGGPNGTSTGPLSLTFHKSCETATFDLLLLQPDTSNVLDYVWLTGQARTAGGTFAIPNTWAPVATTTTPITYSGQLMPSIKLSQVIDGAPFLIDQLQPANGAVALHYAPIAVPTQLEALTSAGPYGTLDHYITVTTGSPATTALDLDALAIPTVTHVVQSATSVTWTETAAGSPDARDVVWLGRWTDGNAVEHDAAWEILEPPTGTTTKLVTLPAMFAADDPVAAGAVIEGSAVTYIDDDSVTGYDAARAIGTLFADVEGQRLTVAHSAHAGATPSFTPP